VYQKYERYAVNQIESYLYEVTGEWQDDIHDLKTRILIDVLSFKIVEAESNGEGVPFDICRQGLARIKDIIGASIGPGLSRTVRSTIMGSQGCTHLGEMIMGSVKAFIQAASRQIPDKDMEELYAAKWREWIGHYSDQCVYFSQPDVSREEIIQAISKAGKPS